MQARDAGFAAVALTDKNGMYGAVRFYRTALERQVKPITGIKETGELITYRFHGK
ncbi:MAG: PHP domain-containing protein [Desulfobacteria bacterium]